MENQINCWQDLEKAKLTESDLPNLVFKMHDGEIVTNAEWERRDMGKPYFVFILPPLTPTNKP